ncbi:MAG: hypothetical protein WA624_19135 [Methylocella sp.]
MSRGRLAALGSIMSTLEQRRDQMFPKLRPEEIALDSRPNGRRSLKAAFESSDVEL